MSVPEYTVRIISHASDRESRKALVKFICTQKSAAKNDPDVMSLTARTVSILEYENARVRIIECDFDPVDEPPGINDIVWVNFTGARPRYDIEDVPMFGYRIKWHKPTGYDDATEHKLNWISQLKSAPETIWERLDSPISVNLGVNNGMYGIPPTTRDRLLESSVVVRGSSAPWREFVGSKFGVKGAQSVISLFSGIAAPGATSREMVIKIPGEIESIVRDGDNTIRVRFI